MNDNTYFLSWQGAITGPHEINEIRQMLRLGKINSLYKINVDGNWQNLRDYLAASDRSNKLPASTGLVRPAPAMEVELVAPDPAPIQRPPHTLAGPSTNDRDQDSAASGIAIASFALSLAFFVPYLNFLTTLLSLIFGHLALCQTSPDSAGRSRGMASLGLWISYTYCGFLAASTALFAMSELPGLRFLYIALHGQMIAIAVAALIGSGLLMLVIKLITGHLISLKSCFVASLLPAALNAFGLIVLNLLLLSSEPTISRSIVCLILLQALILVCQMYFWSGFIKLPGGVDLGVGKAAIASIFQVIILVFIGVLYALLIAAVAPVEYRHNFIDSPPAIRSLGSEPDPSGSFYHDS